MTRVLVLFAAAVVACADLKEAGGDIGGSIAEVVICPFPGVDCGHVYECAEPADNPLGHVEVCVEDGEPVADAEDVYGACKPTPRHEGLCLYHCDGGAGCNAFSGCFGCGGAS